MVATPPAEQATASTPQDISGLYAHFMGGSAGACSGVEHCDTVTPKIRPAAIYASGEDVRYVSPQDRGARAARTSCHSECVCTDTRRLLTGRSARGANSRAGGGR